MKKKSLLSEKDKKSWDDFLKNSSDIQDKEEKVTEKKSDLIEILLDNPTIMKRPIIKSKNKYLVGFNEKKFKLLK